MRLKYKLLTLLTLMLCVGVFSIHALASDGGETLTVEAAWVNGDMLHISVTDADGGASSFALRLSDYVSDAENKEYLTIQAVDLMGNTSAVFEVRNPNYIPTVTAAPPLIVVTPESPETQEQEEDEAPSEPPQSSPLGDNPFTPDGTGTVIDNAHDGDGKEFFTVGTEDGSIFYLIIDRQRATDNVYFLNAVTLDDLVALAERDGNTLNIDDSTMSAIQVPEPPSVTEVPTQPPSTMPEDDEPPARDSGGNNNTLIFVGVAALIFGGAVYYFKIVRGKKNIYADDEDEEIEDAYGYDEPDELDEGGDEE